MPLYEYECERCEHRFERIQKFSDPPVETCPKCGGPVHKLMSSPAIQFKGSGWYITDYARKDSAAAETSDKGEKAGKSESKADKTETKTESKSETKPEKKADTKATSQ
jgi:putative FmdB family regulatory protein